MESTMIPFFGEVAKAGAGAQQATPYKIAEEGDGSKNVDSFHRHLPTAAAGGAAVAERIWGTTCG